MARRGSDHRTPGSTPAFRSFRARVHDAPTVLAVANADPRAAGVVLNVNDGFVRSARTTFRDGRASLITERAREYVRIVAEARASS